MLTETLPVPEGVIDYLKKSKCGLEGTDLRVCCQAPAAVIPTPIFQPSEEAPPDVSTHPNLRLLPQNICGPLVANKIFNGRKTDFYEHPWLAALEYNDTGGNY